MKFSTLDVNTQWQKIDELNEINNAVLAIMLSSLIMKYIIAILEINMPPRGHHMRFFYFFN